MKTTKNRIISLICAFVMVIATVAVAASCKKTNDSPDGSDSASGSVTENDVLANIPDSDFDGYKFKVLARAGEAYTGEIYDDGTTAEPVNEAVYRRNQILQDKYDFEIEVYPVDT